MNTKVALRRSRQRWFGPRIEKVYVAGVYGNSRRDVEKARRARDLQREEREAEQMIREAVA